MQHNSYHTHSNTSPTQVNSLFTCSGTLAKQILHTQTHIETQHKLKRTLCFLPLGHMQHPFLFVQIILCVEARTHWNTQCFDLFMTLDSPHYLPKHVSQEIEDKANSRQVLSSHRDWWGIITLCFSNITSSKDGLKRTNSPIFCQVMSRDSAAYIKTLTGFHVYSKRLTLVNFCTLSIAYCSKLVIQVSFKSFWICFADFHITSNFCTLISFLSNFKANK